MKSKYNNLKNLGVSDFRRLSGVHPETFKKMLKVLRVKSVRLVPAAVVKENFPYQINCCCVWSTCERAELFVILP